MVEPERVIKLNVFGKVCPMPAAETRQALRNMNSGDFLEVEGDFECAAENVAKIAEKNDGNVLSIEHNTNYYKVIIKKK
jgi:tRNA 2-thiouridine synthesizing protein A